VKRTFPDKGPSAPGIKFALANGGGAAAEAIPAPLRRIRDVIAFDNILRYQRCNFFL